MSRIAFIRTAAVMLLFTSVAKFTVFVGNPPIGITHDPVMGFTFHDEFITVGIVEATVAVFCLVTTWAKMQLLLIAALGTCFAVYRVGLTLVGFKAPCPCLGNLPRALHLSKASADAITLGILIYLLVGSYCWLFARGSTRREESDLRSATGGGTAAR